MVSDIYFPLPPSPYPAFYPISYPINITQSPPRPVHASHSMPVNTKPNSMKHHEQVFDANRNHIVPYYYSETMNCTPVTNTLNHRHTFTNYMYNDPQSVRYKLSPGLQSRLASPELSHLFSNSPRPQSVINRPYSVLEPCKSPMSIERPSSVVPLPETQFRLASDFFQKDLHKKEIPEWKLRLQNDLSIKPNMFRGERPFKQMCRIPNCKCITKPAVDPGRFSEARTLPIESEKTLRNSRNLSLPSLKLSSEDSQNCAEKDEKETKDPISEQHLGYV